MGVLGCEFPSCNEIMVEWCLYEIAEDGTAAEDGMRVCDKHREALESGADYEVVSRHD